MLPGLALVVVIVLVAGFVAYIGDRVGHQVGRRRLTLFGLRPKYTSTIVAVATGMLIALAVTLIALLASSYVRTAFFRIDRLNSQINLLQEQALSQQSELAKTRNNALIVPEYNLVANIYRFIDPNATEEEQVRDLSSFFDQTVTDANKEFAATGALRPFEHHSDEPDIQAKLRQEIETIRTDPRVHGPVLVLPLAYQNLFRGDTIAFSFGYWEDKRIARAGEVLATVPVTGGTFFNVQQLVQDGTRSMASRGMPAPFLRPVINEKQLRTIAEQLSRLHGTYHVALKASTDLYPHSQGVAYDFALGPGAR